MVLLFPSNDPSHGHEDPKGAVRLCQLARAGSSLDQGIHTQVESCLGGQEPERRAAPGAAGSQVQSRIMTHLQVEGMEARSQEPPSRSGNVHDQGQITQQRREKTVQPPPCDLSRTLTPEILARKRDSYKHTRLVKTGNGGETEPRNYTVLPLLKDGGVRLSTKGFQIASWTHLQEKNIFKETNETPNGEQLLEKEERPKRPIL